MKKGSKYGLWVDNKIYEIEPQQKVSHFAAEEVKVTGQMANDVIHITSITRLPQPVASASQ